MLGTCGKITVSKDNTTIVDGNGNKEAIAQRVAQIKAQIAATKSEYDKESLQTYEGQSEHHFYDFGQWAALRLNLSRIGLSAGALLNITIRIRMIA